MTKSTADEVANRLQKLLDVGLEAMRGGDEEAALLALMEAEKTAQRLPRKANPPDVISLPGPVSR